MTILKKSANVPYSCAQMYALVDDVEHYPDFLPHCAASTVHHRDADEVQATVMISAVGMQKSFTTKNRLQLNKMIEIRLVDGPFSHLEGFWRFDPTETGCPISFDLEFEFSSRMVSMMLSPIFEEVVKQVFDAFHTRADEIYRDQRIISV
jgi:ribosome-associated toxin RatA of RatAB toxin-antitoxin module